MVKTLGLIHCAQDSHHNAICIAHAYEREDRKKDRKQKRKKASEKRQKTKKKEKERKRHRTKDMKKERKKERKKDIHQQSKNVTQTARNVRGPILKTVKACKKHLMSDASDEGMAYSSCCGDGQKTSSHLYRHLLCVPVVKIPRFCSDEDFAFLSGRCRSVP